MGAYLSEPKTTKESSDSEGVSVKCGASSMQGWRISQEDAHNCILDFDKNTSFFAVYDGHGGHEVAEYCSKNLPDFIKQTENYIKGEYEQALKDAFLGFDATLATSEVISLLKAIVSGKDGEKTGPEAEAGSSSEDDEETVDGLMQEAHMPLDQVMARYKGAGPLCRLLKGEGKPPVSPMLRGRRSASGCGSGDAPSGSGAGTSRSCTVAEDTEVSSTSSSQTESATAAGMCNGEVHMNGDVTEEDVEKKGSEAEVDSSGDVVKEEKVLDKGEKCITDDDEKKVERTEVLADSSGLNNGEAHSVSSSSELEMGTDGISSSSPSKKKKLISSADIYKKLMAEDSDSEEDETFTADAESEDGSSDDVAEGAEKKGDDDDDDEEEEDSSLEDEEDEDDDDTEYQGMDVKEEPGSDSGCTAVVALLVGSELWVANAGDSRCVVCRDGKAVEMSLDHKPEDEPERERIEAAGGKVTCDGRVNGGLNLSRAIGDHSYKQVKLLPPSQQMITALPDVQRLTVDPKQDEFMVLACDGIWNSMSSQEVVDFVRTKLQQNTEKLSQICEELFDHCLAPNTQGDGTGCDNMTCVIVQFKPQTAASGTGKRVAESEPGDAGEQPSAKKSKADDSEAQKA